MALTFTTFLHKGFSDVSVNFFLRASSSSLLSLGPVSCKPQNKLHALLRHPRGCSGSSRTEKAPVNHQLRQEAEITVGAVQMTELCYYHLLVSWKSMEKYS